MTTRAYNTPSQQTVTADPRRQLYLGVEERILELEGWGQVLIHLGSSPDAVEPGAVAVIGQTVARAAEYLKADFQNACAEAGR